MKIMYRDIETGEILTVEQLKKEYEEKIASGEIEKEELPSVAWFIHVCLTCFGGTLEEVEVN